MRVVHSLFASTDDWDDQLESVESGWPTFFRILRLYLTHFLGQSCSIVQLLGVAKEPRGAVWHAVTSSLSLAGARAGQPWNAPADVPPLAGVIEQIGAGKDHYFALARLAEPTSGACSLIVNTVGEAVYVQVSMYLYGSLAEAVAQRDGARWQQWIQELFPAAGDTG